MENDECVNQPIAKRPEAREKGLKKLHSHSEVKHSQSEIEVNRFLYHLLWAEVCALLDITTRQLVLRGH